LFSFYFVIQRALKMSFLWKGRRFLIAGILPILENSADDIKDKENKTYKAFLASKPPEETGLERLKQMFSIEYEISNYFI